MVRFHVAAPALLALAACASTPPPAVLPPVPADARPKSADDQIVAFYNGEPVLRHEVARTVLELNLRGAIGSYVRWRVVQDRMKKLGIENTPEELRRRAATVVTSTRERMGRDAFGAQLAREGLTKDAYRDYVARSCSLSHTFSIEKIVRYDAVVSGSLTLERVWFTDEKEAGRFAIESRDVGFDKALAALGRRIPRVRFGHRAGEILAPGGPALTPPVDPWIADTLRKASPGDVVGVERSSLDVLHVIKVLDRRPPRAVAYEEVKEEILKGILDSPPTEQACDWWVRAAVERASVEMVDPGARKRGG